MVTIRAGSMVNPEIVTLIESLYLLFMYILFQTKYSVGQAYLEKDVQALGHFFVHDTGRYENKVCPFGKVMAVIAVALATIRLYFFNSKHKNTLFYTTLGFDLTCLSLAYVMNLNAFVYVLPIVFGEIYILNTLSKK